MGFSNERMRTGQLVNWFLLDGLELTPAGNPVTKALPQSRREQTVPQR